MTWQREYRLARYALAAGEREARLRDLVRYQRAELHAAKLISDEEYAELLSDGGSVARLHSYDDLRKREAAKDAEIERLRGLLRETRESVNAAYLFAVAVDNPSDARTHSERLARIDAALAEKTTG